MSRIESIIDSLEAERAEAVARVEWLDAQLEEFRTHAAERAAVAAAAERTAVKPEPRSARRQTAKRASTRRQTARKVKRDVPSEIVLFLEKHPNSTAGDIAKGVSLSRSSVSTHVSALAKAGTIRKTEHGYVATSE